MAAKNTKEPKESELAPDSTEGYGEAKHVTETWVFEKLVSMETSQDNARSRQLANREAYENKQEPDNVPADKTFVPDNLVTEFVKGKQGQLIGGEFTTRVKYGGEYGELIAELHDDILETNEFQMRHLEPLANRFTVEGKTGAYIEYHPYIKTQYNIGMPIIHSLRADETLLDDESRGYLHEDDKIRSFPKRELVDDVERKYGIKVEADDRYNSSSGGYSKYCTLYITEFIESEFTNKGGFIVEDKKVYECIIANKKQTVKKPYYLGKRWRILCCIHTPTESDKAGKEGISDVDVVLPKQDNINAIKTWLFEALEKGLKKKPFFTGVTPAEAQHLADVMAGLDEVLYGSNLGAKVYEVGGTGLDNSLIEYYNMEREAFDTTGGRSNLERGKVGNEGMAGKLFIAAASAGAIPALTPKRHFEYFLSQISYVILECIADKMNRQKFYIERDIDGAERKIYFNTPADEVPDYNRYDKDKYMIPSENKDGVNIVNDLLKADFDKIDITVEVNLNILGKHEQEAEKALVAHDKKLMTPFDTNKRVYPKEYNEINKNLKEFNFAYGLIDKLMQIKDPELKGQILKAIEDAKQFDEQSKQLLTMGDNGQ